MRANLVEIEPAIVVVEPEAGVAVQMCHRILGQDHAGKHDRRLVTVSVDVPAFIDS